MRAQCGDREALEALLRSAQLRLRRYLRGVVGVQRCDDVLQDALLVICRKLPGLRVPELFWPWAFRIASRIAFADLRQERVRAEQPLDSGPEPVTITPSSAMLENLLACKSVPVASKAVLTLHFAEQLTLAEVAAVLDLPVGTVKSRLAAGLAALRVLLQEGNT
jgi:RNA polymerase sigma-70 factor (ECF subfamily)